MKLQGLLVELERRELELFIQAKEGTAEVRVSGPTEELTDDLLEALREHRETIRLRLLEADDRLLKAHEFDIARRAPEDPPIVHCGQCKNFKIDAERPWSTVGRCRRFDLLRIANLPEVCWAWEAIPPEPLAQRARQRAAA